MRNILMLVDLGMGMADKLLETEPGRLHSKSEP